MMPVRWLTFCIILADISSTVAPTYSDLDILYSENDHCSMLPASNLYRALVLSGMSNMTYFSISCECRTMRRLGPAAEAEISNIGRRGK